MKDKLYINEDNYFSFCDLLDRMNYRAEEFAPTVDEINNIIIPNIKYFYKLLMWIDETGIKTEENKESRKLIKDILKEQVILTSSITHG